MREVRTHAMRGLFRTAEYGKTYLQIPPTTWTPTYHIVLTRRPPLLLSAAFLGPLGAVLALAALTVLIRSLQRRRRRRRRRSASLRLLELTEPISHGRSAMLVMLFRLVFLLRGTNEQSGRRQVEVAREIRTHLLPDMDEMGQLVRDAGLSGEFASRFDAARLKLARALERILGDPVDWTEKEKWIGVVQFACDNLTELRREVETRFEADLVQVLQSCLDAAWLREFPDLRIVVSSAGAGTCRVQCDSHELRLVLSELLENAARAVSERPEPRIEVTLERAERVLRVLVTDNGPGIPRRDHERCFDLGWSGSGSTGSGLFHARRRVRRFGGRLGIRDDGSGPGATFELVLTLRPVLSATGPDSPHPSGYHGRSHCRTSHLSSPERA